MSQSHFDAFCSVVSQKSPFQRKIVDSSLNTMSKECRDDGEAYINYCLSLGETISDLAEAYLGFVDVMNEEQLFFAREGRYRYSKLSEVEGIVYNNPVYMQMYMRGLALTMFLWPQHQQTRAFFGEKLPRNNKGRRYLEIGPGHGMFFLHAIRNCGFDKCIGIDISPTSIMTTQSLLSSGHFANVMNAELICADFLTYNFDHKFHAIIIGEVLEHVERPESFIKRIAACIETDGVIFLSTCLNAAALDHIYNFETLDRLESMFSAYHLGIREHLLIPYTGKTVKQCLRKRFPMNVAYILAPQHVSG